MAKANRECHTCSTKYYYCPTCPDDNRNPRIYVMWCGERCAKIFNLLSDETFNNITTEECKDALLKLNITEKDNLKDNIKKHIQRVMNCEVKNNVTDSVVIEELSSIVKITEPIVEAAIESSEHIESIEITAEITDNNSGYKKRNKKYRNSEVD